MALGGAVPETADPTALTRVSAEFGVQATSTNAALKPFSAKLDDSTLSGDTEFSAMSATIVFVDGVATNDLDVKSPLLRVTGNGGANLPQDTVDYLVKAGLVKACEGQSGASADKLVGIPLPIRASGPMASPKIAPDWATLGTALAGSKLKKAATSLLKDKLKIPGLGGSEDAGAGDVGDALKKGLKSLF
jgi:AsmA protein